MCDFEWHPSKDEVAHIVKELGPLLTEMSRREEAALRAEVARRVSI